MSDFEDKINTDRSFGSYEVPPSMSVQSIAWDDLINFVGSDATQYLHTHCDVTPNEDHWLLGIDSDENLFGTERTRSQAERSHYYEDQYDLDTHFGAAMSHQPEMIPDLSLTPKSWDLRDVRSCFLVPLNDS